MQMVFSSSKNEIMYILFPFPFVLNFVCSVCLSQLGKEKFKLILEILTLVIDNWWHFMLLHSKSYMELRLYCFCR